MMNTETPVHLIPKMIAKEPGTSSEETPICIRMSTEQSRVCMWVSRTGSYTWTCPDKLLKEVAHVHGTSLFWHLLPI